MFCAISGKPPVHPVLSPSSRCLFEKELLLQHIEKTGTDPITNSPLKATDVIEINTNVANSLPNFLNSSTLGSNYSIPTLLSTLQHEYDAIMLENFQLRKEVNKAVQELSRSLYERDAAKLVAAGLLRDRMNVKADLDTIVRHYMEGEGGINVGSGPPHDGTQDLLEKSQEYVRRIKELRGASEVKSKNFKTCITVPSKPIYVANCSIKSEFTTRWPPVCGSSVTTLLTGGQVRKTVVLLSLSAEQDEVLVFNSSNDHTGPLSYKLPFDIKDINLLSVSPGVQRIFLLQEGTNTLNVYNVNSGAHTVLPLDQTGELESHTILLTQHEYVMRDYTLRVTSDGHVSYLSLDKPRLDIDVVLPSETDLEIDKDQVGPGGTPVERYHSATLHKDGILLALTSTRSVTIVNLARPRDEPTVFRLGREIPILSTSAEEHPDLNERVSEVRFSSNGYWMLVCVGYRIVVFDLRRDETTVVSTCILEELAKRDPGESIDMVWDMDPEGTFLVGYNRGYGSTESPLIFYKYDKKAKEWRNWTAEYDTNDKSDSKDAVLKLGEDIVGIQLLETTTDGDETTTLPVLVQCPTKSYVLEYF